MKKFKVKKKHLIGEIADFPRRVVQAMVDEQVRQGNPADPCVFSIQYNATKIGGGFDWGGSLLGDDSWIKIIMWKQFHLIPKRQNMGDFDPRTWTNIPTWRVNLEMGFTENLEDFAGLELNDLMDALLNHALKKVESENPLATDLAEAFLFEVDWQNIAQVILEKLE